METLLLTGGVEIDGERVHREDCRELISLHGGQSKKDWARDITVVVAGIQDARRLSDDEKRLSGKLLSALEFIRAGGHHVHIIDGTGLGALFNGQPALCRTVLYSNLRWATVG